MKAVKKFVIQNWIWLVIGIVLTRKAVEYAYDVRGYVAIGGEWLILPFILMTIYLFREIIDLICNMPDIECFKEEDTDDRRFVEHNHRLEKKGAIITDEEAEYLLWYCERRMDVCKIQNRKEYLPLLYADEVKNYLIRRCVNAKTILHGVGKEEERCVQFV